MQQIITYIKNYCREEFRPVYFAIIGLFLAGSLYINYTYDFETTYVASYNSRLSLTTSYFLFYALPFFFSIGAYALCYKKFDFLRNLSFWFVSIFAILVLALDASSDLGFAAIPSFIPASAGTWFIKCSNELIQVLVLAVPPIIYWFIADRKRMKLYGVWAHKFSPRPYFIMLLLILPFVVYASFKADFIQTYPRYRANGAGESLHPAAAFLIFELLYGLAYASVEFFFRGFMIHAQTRHLGKGIIVPMAAVYCFIHFQKPLLEAASSIFGGMLLGIISYYSYSIYGGIIAHIGIAWMMEIFALVQIHLLQGKNT
ncbi:MAG: hypothetical protein GY754_31700 [bacterium]|nr:hypothetical protein [bacterium]